MDQRSGQCCVLAFMWTFICNTYLNIGADQVHVLIVTVFTNDGGLFQQHNMVAAKFYRNGLMNMTKNSM